MCKLVVLHNYSDGFQTHRYRRKLTLSANSANVVLNNSECIFTSPKSKMYHNYFVNKIAIVTGGGSGIGCALCLKLAAAGAQVVCADINLSRAEETAGLTGNAAIPLKLDVSICTEVEAMLNSVAAQFGRIDIIFNNAGISVGGELRDLSVTDFEKVMGVNFYGMLYGSQAAYKLMLQQGHGQIVNTSSGAGLIDGVPLLAPYSVSKHAVVSYSKVLRTEAKALGIKVSVVCPGMVSTAIVADTRYVNALQNAKDYSITELSKGISAEKAADHILRGVAANKAVIIFPVKMKIALLLSRLFKAPFRVIMSRMIAIYRKQYRKQTPD